MSAAAADAPGRLRVCVVTGTRAEYGLFRPLLRAIVANEAMELTLVVTGAHLSEAFGGTYREIETDGFEIAERAELPLGDDSELGIARATGAAVSRLAEAFGRTSPDVVVLLGDRYETLAAASAALLARIPIAHVHGGEVTEGAVDDAIRHAVTKMALLHFTAAEPYRRRVVQMGEEPERVFCVGALGLDAIREEDLLSREELEAELGMALAEPFALVTFHPVTLLPDGGLGEARALMEALLAHPGLTAVFTRPNADAGNRAIADLVERTAEAMGERGRVFASLGSRRYLSAMGAADVVIGNSSSGILEAPSFGTPTVNVGERQAGRLRAASVIDCPAEPAAISAALARALSSEFRAVAAAAVSPYGDGHAAERIVSALLASKDRLADARKRFHDCDCG